MKVDINLLLVSALVLLSACKSGLEPIADDRINDYHSLIRKFKDPGIDYRPAPLWVWNNEVSREDIDFSLAELKKQGIGGCKLE